MKYIHIALKDETYKKLKLAGVEQDSDMTEISQRAIERDLETNKYPIFRDYDQKEIVGWVELNKEIVFMTQDILAPEVINAGEGLKGLMEKGAHLAAFGLIQGKNYLVLPESRYGDLEELKGKNVNQ